MYEIFFEEGVEHARVVLSGRVTVNGMLDVLDALTTDGTLFPKKRLLDTRDCELVLSSVELKQIADMGKSRDAASTNSRIAVLVSSDLNFGISKIYEAHRESDNHEVRVFRSESDALAWLTEVVDGDCPAES